MSWSLFWSKNSCDHGKGYHFKSHIHPIVNTYWTVSRRQALMLLWHNFLLIVGQHALDSSLILLRLNVWQQAAGCKCKQSPRQSAAMQQATDVGLPLSLLSYCLKITQHRWLCSTMEVHTSRAQQCSWWEMWVMWAATAFLISALPACLAASSCRCCILDITYRGPCFFFRSPFI